MNVESEKMVDFSEVQIQERKIPIWAWWFLWLIILVFPLLFFEVGLKTLIGEEQISRTGSWDERLSAEMSEFESDLMLKNQVTKAVRQVGNKVGFFPETRTTDFSDSSNPDPKLFTQARLKVFVKELKKELGTKPLTVFIWGCDGRESAQYCNEKFFSGLNKPSPRVANMIMAYQAGIDKRKPFGYPIFFIGERKKWLGPSGVIRKEQTENFCQMVFGDSVAPPFREDDTQTYFSAKFGEGQLFVYSRFLYSRQATDAPIIGGIIVTYHSRMFSWSGILRRAKQAPSDSPFQRLLFTKKLFEPPGDLPGFREIGDMRYLIKPLPVTVAGLTCMDRKSFYDVVTSKRSDEREFELPFLGVGCKTSHVQHPLNRLLPFLDGFVRLLIAFSAVFLVRLLLRGNLIEIGLRWKLLLFFSGMVVIPLLGFFLVAYSYFGFQEKFEERQVLSHMNLTLRNFEAGLNNYKSFVHRDIWNFRKDLVENISKPRERLKEIFLKWENRSEKELFAQFYFAHRDGWDYFSQNLMRGTGDSLDLPKRILQVFLVFSTKFQEIFSEWVTQTDFAMFPRFYSAIREGTEFFFTALERGMKGGAGDLPKDLIQVFRVFSTNFLVLSQHAFRSGMNVSEGIIDFHKNLEANSENVTENTFPLDQFTKNMAILVLRKPGLFSYCNDLLVNAGKLMKSALWNFGGVETSQFLISSGQTGSEFGKGVLLIVFPIERLTRNYFSEISSDASLFPSNYGGYKIRYGLYKTTVDRQALLSSEVEDPAGKELARKVLFNGQEILRREKTKSNFRLVSGRLFQDYPYVAVAFAEPVSFSRQHLLSVSIAVLIVLSLLIIVIVTRVMSSFLIEPFEQFHIGIKEIDKGNYKTSMTISTEDEFEDLALVFNDMAKGLWEREEIRKFVPEKAMEAVKQEGDGALTPGGKRIKAVVLFSDVRSFTTITERYSATEVVEMLNSYFGVMVPAIKKFGGDIDKFIGDAIQAVFYPVEGEESPALRACYAGLEMRRQLAKFNRDREERGEFCIDNGVGIAQGDVVAGKVGSRFGLLEFTVVGDIVHFASHLEAESKKGKSTCVVVSESIYEQISPIISGEQLGVLETWRDRNDLPYFEIHFPEGNLSP